MFNTVRCRFAPLPRHSLSSVFAVFPTRRTRTCINPLVAGAARAAGRNELDDDDDGDYDFDDEIDSAAAESQRSSGRVGSQRKQR